MDPDTLRIFLAVAHALSITQAARQLGRVPSNVTTRIQQLEAELGAGLFLRSGKRLSLSPAGERLQDYARRLLALEDEARQAVTGLPSGTLRMGSMESTAASRLPAPLARFHQAHPSMSVQLSTGPTRALLEGVTAGRLDCAFVALPPDLALPEALHAQGLQAQEVWQEDLRLLMPASEQAARGPHDLTTRTLIAFAPGCTYRHLAQTWLQADHASAWRIHEMASYHAMIACVAAGVGVTLLPASVLALSAQPADLPSLPVAQVATQLVWRQGYATPAFAHWRTLLKSAAHAGARGKTTRTAAGRRGSRAAPGLR